MTARPTKQPETPQPEQDEWAIPGFEAVVGQMRALDPTARIRIISEGTSTWLTPITIRATADRSSDVTAREVSPTRVARA